MTHTQAPWEKVGNWVVLIGTRHQIDLYKSKDSPDQNDEAEATARLIAAAPDLLEALDLLTQEIPTEVWEALPQYVQDKAIIALNKAKGKL